LNLEVAISAADHGDHAGVHYEESPENVSSDFEGLNTNRRAASLNHSLSALVVIMAQEAVVVIGAQRENIENAQKTC
jgi:hypothetical protein